MYDGAYCMLRAYQYIIYTRAILIAVHLFVSIVISITVKCITINQLPILESSQIPTIQQQQVTLIHQSRSIVNNIALIGAVIFLFSNISCSIVFVSSQIQTPITKPIISFCTGGAHICAVFDNKKMKCWGKKYSWGLSSKESLGDVPEELGDSIPYVDVGKSIAINKVSCGNDHICIILDTRDMKCMGLNAYGQIGIGKSTDPIGYATGYIGDDLPIINLGLGLQVHDIALGYRTSCALLTGNKVKCYGWNDFGTLGYGDTTQRGASPSDMDGNLPFIDFGTDVDVASVHSGSSSFHNCVILSKPANVTQRIKCWGWNRDYQLGYGNYNNRGDQFGEMGDKLPLVDLGTESRVKQLALGIAHTCILLINNVLKCFGSAFNGELGSGSIADIIATGNLMPSVLIDSGKIINLLSAGCWHTCIVYDDMFIMKCVGYNDSGQLGQGDTVSKGSSLTTRFPFIPAIQLGTGSLKISSIHCGYTFTCAIFEDDSVKCFGSNDYGQFAIGSTRNTGDELYEMGNNLTFATLFSPTQAPTPPTASPTKSPSKSPTPPTLLPTKLPTVSPTKPCDYQSAKICKYDYNCMWAKVEGVKKCVVFDCTPLSQGKCGKQSKRCKWNKKTTHCETKKKI